MIANATEINTEEPTQQRRWFLIMLVILTLLYWVFARYLERVDLSVGINRYWQSVLPGSNAPSFIIFGIEMLHPRVWRHLVPVGVGWWLAHEAAVNLVKSLYDLPDKQAAKNFLAQLQSSLAMGMAVVKADAETLEDDREKSVLLRLGGPGRVRIGNNQVGITELNGRFHRVLDPGSHRIGRLERVYTVLDLRQQERTLEEVPVLTKDGIELKISLTISFRIHTGGAPVTKAKPYPYDPDSPRLAAYAETVLPDGSVARWDGAPVTFARGQLSGIVSNYKLDEILYPHSTTREPFRAIRDELERKVRHILSNYGIELISIAIGQVLLPEEVEKQYLEYWRTDWDTQIHLIEAEGDAFSLEEIEIARAEAEVTMIRAIIEGVQRARQEGSTDMLNEVVALRLIEAMEKITEDSESISNASTGLLPQLAEFRRQLMPRVEQ